MLEKCYCVLTNANYLPDFQDGDVIGVDKGAWLCFQKGISMTAALGDFDSISDKERQLLSCAMQNMIVLNPRKDVSDSEAAVQWAKEQGYKEIVLVTDMAGRFDHSYVNFCLVANYDCTLIDQNNKVFLVHEGISEITKDNYRYISFFACDDAEVTLKGFSYPLENYLMKRLDVLGLSNELIQDTGVVTATGKLWCIQSNDSK